MVNPTVVTSPTATSLAFDILVKECFDDACFSQPKSEYMQDPLIQAALEAFAAGQQVSLPVVYSMIREYVLDNASASHVATMKDIDDAIENLVKERPDLKTFLLDRPAVAGMALKFHFVDGGRRSPEFYVNMGLEGYYHAMRETGEDYTLAAITNRGAV